MKNLDEMVDKFRNLLLSSRDLGEPMSAFLDLSETSEFQDQGLNSKCEAFDNFLPVAAKALMGKEVPVPLIACFYFEKYKIYSGYGLMGSSTTTIIYDETSEKGLLAVYDLVTGSTNLMRITNIPKESPDQPIFLASPREPATD